MPSNEQVFEVYGTVIASLPNNMYRVKIKGDRLLLCKIIYRMTKRRIKVVPGDMVTVEVKPTDLTRGRIVYRGVRGQGVDETAPQKSGDTKRIS